MDFDVLTHFGVSENTAALVVAALFLLSLAFFIGRFYERLTVPTTISGLRKERDDARNKINDLQISIGRIEKDKASEISKATESLKTARAKSRELRQTVVKYEAVREALFGDEDELWKLYPPTPPSEIYFRELNKSSARVITVANLKGGVGKTTLAANLVAYLCRKLGKRVLAIDLDYQGSLSSALTQAAGLEFTGSLVDRFVSGKADGQELVEIAKPLNSILPNTDLLTASYNLSRLENRLMLQWLLGEAEDDIRFNLGSVLVSEEVRDRYDVVVIDAPPRMTTAAINAYAASHHVLIPTIPDLASSEAVARFANHVRDLRLKLNPNLNFAGVVVNMSRVRELGALEKQALDAVRADLQKHNVSPHIFEQNIPRLAAVAGLAGQDVAYLRDKAFREGIMDHLGDEIAERIGLQVAA